MSDQLTDPSGSSSLVAAVAWLQGTMLGTLATSIAITAVASVGFMMLTGRVNFRHGITVIIGCFIIFGASSIAAGIQAAAGGEFGPDTFDAPIAQPSPPPVLANPTPQPTGYDPYAGASVPL